MFGWCSANSLSARRTVEFQLPVWCISYEQLEKSTKTDVQFAGFTLTNLDQSKTNSDCSAKSQDSTVTNKYTIGLFATHWDFDFFI
jgi:hypothetical protein